MSTDRNLRLQILKALYPQRIFDGDKLENYVLDDGGLPPHVQSRRSLHEALDAALDELELHTIEGILEPNEGFEWKIRWAPMTEKEMESLPDL